MNDQIKKSEVIKIAKFFAMFPEAVRIDEIKDFSLLVLLYFQQSKIKPLPPVEGNSTLKGKVT